MAREESDTPQGKSVAASAIRAFEIPEILLRGNFNSRGTLFGGYLMALMDTVAARVAQQHVGDDCVTKLVDSIDFVAPVFAGEHLSLWASVNRAWRTSLEVGVRVCARKSGSSRYRHVVSAYFTFVHIDAERKRPSPVPPVIPRTAKERKRFAEADVRRQWRLANREQH